MVYPPSPEISAAELRAYVLAQVERLEIAVAPIRDVRRAPLGEARTPAERRAELELRVRTLEGRFELGGR